AGPHRTPARRGGRQDGRPGRRRAVLGPNGPRRTRRPERPRSATCGPARGPGRPRPPRTPDPRRLRGEEPAHLAARGGARPAHRGRRAGGCDDQRRGRNAMKRHLISAADLSRGDAVLILDTAEELASLADRPIKKLPTLRGRTVVNLFYEDSTRTRISFEAAAKRLSADVINFSAKGSSVAKGESLKDTALTLEAMGADAVIVRHSAAGAPHRLAGWVRGSVVNAGDGSHEHPTQALLDAFTIRRRLGGRPAGGGLDGLRVTIVGDVLHSRVARSNVLLL